MTSDGVISDAVVWIKVPFRNRNPEVKADLASRVGVWRSATWREPIANWKIKDINNVKYEKISSICYLLF